MSLLNQTQVRDFVFSAIRQHRPAMAHKMNRVSAEFYERIETQLRARLFAVVREASRGDFKTLRVPEPLCAPREQTLPWLVCQTSVRNFLRAAMQGTDLALVSGDFLNWVDGATRRLIVSHIQSMPSSGKTV